MKQTLAQALERRGYDSLTRVQEAVTDPALGTSDLLVSAQTGSGKTVGFGLAIATSVLGDADKFGPAAQPLALVIAPTRELALQVKRELSWLYADAGATVASCVGGMDMRDERRALERGAHIVVATPGRLRDHITRSSIDLGDIRAVVLDEADEMLDLGFREDLEFILSQAPDDRQTLLFSATVPREIEQLAKSFQRDAVRVTTLAEKEQHADIDYRAMLVSNRDSENAIINALRFYEAPNAIVFCNTRAMVNRLLSRLTNRGFAVVALSGELSQAERSHALQAMRDGRARVCVATDVAARGIDLPNLSLVLHAELPNSHETLLHRSGRTGRAGRKGVSALIVPPKSRKKAERLLKMAKLQAEWCNAPSATEVNDRDAERMHADPVWEEAVTERELASVTALAGQFSPEQLAAVCLRLWKAGRSAPEELSAVEEKPGPREPFGPSVWFSIAQGRNDGADPRRLLPMLCRAGDITKSDIGAIRIQQDETFAEIREAQVAGFLAAMGSDMQLDDGTKLTRLNAAPQLGSSSYGKKPDYNKRKPAAPHRKTASRDGGASESYSKPAYKSESKPAYKSDSKPAYKSDDKRDTAKKAGGSKTDWSKPSSSGRASGDKARPRSASAEPRPSAAVVIPRGPKAERGFKGRSRPSEEGGKGKEWTKPKGPRPPAGKPSSKKNKARATPKGGSSAPSRRP